MKKHGTTVILLLVLIAGLSLLLYPTLANWWNSMTQSRAVASYVDAVANIDQAQYDHLWDDAWNAEEFTISAEHDIEAAQPQLTQLTGGDLLTGYVNPGILHGEIENKSGIELPETGGIGTTIFYAIGGLLVVAAVVLLVTKKRMASAK